MTTPRDASGPAGTYGCDCTRDDPAECNNDRDVRLGRSILEPGMSVCFCLCHKWRAEEAARRNPN